MGECRISKKLVARAKSQVSFSNDDGGGLIQIAESFDIRFTHDPELKICILANLNSCHPAGHWPQLLAAIESGADAVYFGLNHFSARAKVGFELEELPEVFATLHSRSVKGFVTFNTLVFDDELGEAEKAIVKIAEANADAIIVQDIGIAQLCQRAAPNLVVHGSTQMSVTSAQGAELAKHFGCSRVVLARELSLKDIANITKVTDVELESFVHGALCVSYSGQCFSSEAWGGRKCESRAVCSGMPTLLRPDRRRSGERTGGVSLSAQSWRFGTRLSRSLI